MKIYIGMPYEEARNLFAIEDITSEQDMKNGYFWLRGKYTLFGEKTSTELCFKDGLLWMMCVYPHYNDGIEREPFSVSDRDYRICDLWVRQHKDELPESAKAFYDIRTPQVGVVIR